jgi:MFS family permease
VLFILRHRKLTATGIVCPLYGISLFLPSIIRGLGYTSSTAQLLTVPIYITASVLAVAVAWYSDRVGKRYPFILVCMCIMAVGFIMCVASATPGVIYAGVFIAACALYPAFPGNITWLSNSEFLAVAIAVCNMLIHSQILLAPPSEPPAKPYKSPLEISQEVCFHHPLCLSRVD